MILRGVFMGKKRNSITGCSAKAFITVDNITYLWYEVKFLDDEGNKKEIIWYLPKEKTEEYVKSCLENIEKQMNDYIYANPNCSLIEELREKPQK